MNISEISVTENCEERLRPLFLIKLSSTQKEKNLDQIVIDDFIQSLLKGFDSKYHTEFYTILKYLINTENIKEKQDLLNRLKKLTYDDLLTISKLNLFNRQLLSKFIKLETKELNSETNNLISYLQTQNFDYNNFLELKHKEITILDDNVYNTICDTHSEQINELAKALAAAQGELEPAEKNATAAIGEKGKLSRKYADLTAMIDAVRKVLPKHGLSIAQIVLPTEGVAHVRTMLMHESGQWLASECRMPYDNTGSKNTVQSMGSAITYARRYSLSALVG